MTTIHARDGVVSVDITGDFFDGLVDGAFGRVRRRFASEHGTILNNAKALWPVRSGQSKAGLEVRERIGSDAIESVLMNREPYAYKIRFSSFTKAEIRAMAKSQAQRLWVEKKRGKGAPSAYYTMRPVWNTLATRPHNAAVGRLRVDIEKDLDQLARRSR